MANHLDELYDAYSNSPRSNSSPDALIAGVRQEAMRMTRDEDIAQDACIVVLNKLASFVRADATAFGRWVRTIIRRTRLAAFGTSSIHTREYDENSVSSSDTPTYPDISGLPDDVRHVAQQLIEGYSLVEIAGQLNVTSAALRNKLARFRKASVTKYPTKTIYM